MATNPNLRVRISADLADIKQGLAVLRGDLRKLKDDAARSGPNTSSWVAGLKSARAQLVGFVAAYASLRTLGSLAKVSDEAAGITGRLRLATKSQEEFNAAQDETFDIAQRTQASWKETVALYNKVSQSADQVGLSQKKQLELTEAVSMALAISGSTGEESAGVMRQFGQALGSARVQAEEFNSINEGGQRIVQALAKHLGIASGQVKAYVNAGKVSNRDLAQALLKDQADLRAEYEKMPKTIGGAFAQIRNSFVRFVGDQNEATGSAQAFVSILRDIATDLPQFFKPILELMQQVANNLRDTESAADSLGKKTSWLAGAGEFLANVFRVLAAAGIVVKNVVEIITLVLAALGTTGFKVAEGLVKYLGGAFRNIANTWQTLKDEGPVAAVKAYAAGVGGIMDDLTAQRQSMVAGFQAASDMIRSDAKDLARGVTGLFAQIDATTARVRGKASETGGDGSGGGGGAGKAVAASNALMRDSVTRALAELDRLYAENEIGMREYFATRLELQQQSIDLQIAQAQAELAATKDAGKRQKLEEQITILQRDRADIATKGAQEQKKAEDELAKSLGDVQLKLMELDGRTGAAERAKLETEYQDLFKRLDASSDATGRKMVENLIDRLVAKAKADELKQAGENIANALQGKEASIGAQVAGGMLGYSEGERQVAAARAKAITDLQALRVAAQASLADMKEGTPEHAAVLAGIGAIDVQIGSITASQQVFKQKMEDIAVSSFGDFLGDLTTGAKSFREAFADMVKSFVAGVAKMVAQEAALRMIRDLFGGTATGNATGKSSVSLKKYHSGGKVGYGGTRVRLPISSMLLGNAPRFHSGGGFGLDSDERLSILQTGERVLSRKQTVAYDSARGLDVQININNQTSGGATLEQTGQRQDGGRLIADFVLKTVAADISGGGQVAKAGQQAYGWRRQGVSRV
ncbi:tape measure protein [Stenotrophomonas sp. UBA7606]|uniref:tape measure protein n=1 Tax=Stenotrophomonas sp. UBA7606 TaxID=1947559 RepID=UPI0025FD3AD8|nr:tape measure protein [Stenotrophomonas sp. UBA7606]